MTHRFEFLDGLRGVAAIVVVLLHLTSPIGIDKSVVPHAHLAVDFFFCLSGFVLAHAYGQRIGTELSVSRFFALRLIRLYPLLAIGATAGTAVLMARLLVQRDTAQVWNLLGASFTNLLFAPSPLFQTGHSEAWPANVPQWSLFFEFAISLSFPWLVRMSNRLLAAIAAVAGVLVLLFALLNGGVGGGPNWENWPLGFIRVAYPFTIGILLFRIWSAAPRQPSASARRALVLTGLLIGVLVIHVPERLNWLYEALAVLLLLPALLMVSASVTPATWLLPASIFLGAVSYPLYAIHYPIVRLVSGTLRRIDGVSGWMYGLVFAITLVASLLLAWVALKKFDEPVRRWLIRRLRNASPRPTIAPTRSV